MIYMMMMQDIASPLFGTYKAVNSSLVYTKAEGCSLNSLIMRIINGI